jgi:hypothetical protein
MLLFPTIALLAVEAVSPDLMVDSDPETVVCKVEAKTNTRFGTRTCHTRSEWKLISEQNRRAAREALGQGLQNSPCGDLSSCDKNSILESFETMPQ